MKNSFLFLQVHLIPNQPIACNMLLVLFIFLGCYTTPVCAQEKVKLKWLNVGFHTQPGQNPNNPGTIIPEKQLIQLLDTLVLYTEGIRIFGVDTNLQKVPHLAKERGLKVVVGIWIGSSLAENEKQIKKGIEIAKAGFADRLIVGSEALLRNNVTPAKLIEYINQVKQNCPNIPVSTADVYYKFIENPAVIAACSQIDINVYPFWEKIPVECALQRFHQAYLSVLAVSGGKKIWISESGWKSKGSNQGPAIASLSNAVKYDRELLGWSKAHGVEVCLFEAFDEPWKGTFDDGWGIFDNTAKLKPGMEVLFKSINKMDSTWLCKKVNTAVKDTLGVTFAPPIGSYLTLKGYVNLFTPCDHKIIIYIKVPGANWWTKPTFAQPSVPILCDGTWEAQYTTGGSDEKATDICVFLVPTSYKPPACSGCGVIPAEVYKNAIAWKCINRPPLTQTTIQVSKDTICEGDSITLTVPGGPYFIWNEQQTTASIKVAPFSSRTYTVTVFDGKGGGATAKINITVRPRPKMTIKPEGSLFVCPNEALTLTVSGAASYLWNTGHVKDTIVVYLEKSENITAKGVDNNGCANTVSKYVSVRNLPFVKIGKLNTLYKVTDDSVKMAGQPSNGQFSGNGVDGNFFHPQKAGIGKHTIYYAYTDFYGCTNKDSIIITVSPSVPTNYLPIGISSIKVFPNPARDNLSLEMEIDKVQMIAIILTDMNGRQVARQQFQPFNTGINTVHLNLKGLSKGAYILSARIKHREIWSKLITVEPN